jgi:hypothetical protein
MILKIFSQKHLAKKLAYLVPNTFSFVKNLVHNIGCKEVRHFFAGIWAKIAENCDYNIDPRPWMASIGYYDQEKKWKHQCGATLVSDHHFLTAAHCASNRRWFNFLLNTRNFWHLYLLVSNESSFENYILLFLTTYHRKYVMDSIY